MRSLRSIWLLALILGVSASLAFAQDDQLKRGEEIFKQICWTCHGNEGKGDGPAGVAFDPPPRDWTNKEWQAQITDDQLFNSIKNGKGNMPPWGGQYSDDDIRAVIQFVRQSGK